MKNKDFILMQLLKKVEPDTPDSRFTDTVMELLEMDVEKELQVDTKFVDFLNRPEAIDSNNNLTGRILGQIDSQESNPKFLPLIGKRTVLTFIFLMLVLITMAFLVEGETTEDTKVYSLSFLYEWLNNSSQNLSLLFISIISGCSLLFIDYAIKNIVLKNNKLHS